jgi:hypothetical protein
MTWLEKQSDIEHLNLLHLTNIKKQVLDIFSDQLEQIALHYSSGCRPL